MLECRVPKPFYTGDTIIPAVALRYRNGGAIHDATVRVQVEAPAAAVGELVARAGAKEARVEGDHPNAFALAASGALKKKRVPTKTTTIVLYDDGLHEDGSMGPDGICANPVDKLLRYEGTYTFHAVAQYGDGCRGRREAVWSVHVEPGITPRRTTARFAGKQRRGEKTVTGAAVVTPRDAYGTLLGPARADRFTVSGAGGARVTGVAEDRGDGTYAIPLEWEPRTTPALILTQPGRDPVVVSAESARARRTTRKKGRTRG